MLRTNEMNTVMMLSGNMETAGEKLIRHAGKRQMERQMNKQEIKYELQRIS